MAVKWAVANGNWTDGTTWNDGFVPTSGDYVYCNGKTISFTTTINIGNGTISNEVCPNTGLNGGKIQPTSGPVNITANLIADGEVIYQSGHFSNTITGNVTVKNCNYGLYRNGNTLNSTWNINGNVVVENAYLMYDLNATMTVNINGNAEMTNLITPIKNINVITINGNLRLDNYSLNINSSSTINGTLTALLCRVYAPTLRIGGDIYYTSNNTTIGIAWQTLTISNQTKWKDISEPRANPFIILTDADMSNTNQYPPENEVKQGTEYVWGEKVGTYQQPPESVVLQGYVYDNGDKTGTLQNQNLVGCVTKEDVREGVALLGMGEVGTLVVPSVDDVREGVIFDNGSVGTLIVQGGGDRLRIADFGYYTNSQSDTYIVDITEADKPKFAVAEERILIEMFPELDLDNIPDKYFDELFVKFLKYRLIVEYYRTAGINSTFTPSEPTTEIVNYQNVRNEVWLNSANIYLKAWAKKYPDSVKKQRTIL